MATAEDTAQSEPLPNAEEGRLIGTFGMGRREATEIAKQVVEDHRKGKAAAFYRTLTSQKYAFHIDGEGDAQWADIIGGRQVKIPRRRKGALRHQDNILRPMVDYWVSYFTSSPIRVVAEHRADRKSRDRARIDTIVANHHLHEQRINDRTAEAMYMSAFNGFGILHSMWRNDVVQQDGSEPQGSYGHQIVQPGYTDIFAGNPFDTVFAPTATRSSVPWLSYGRTLPVQLVQEAFADVPGIEKIEGSDQEPSTGWFQRMLRKWEFLSGGAGYEHGSAALMGTGGEENVALVCKEILPGQLSQYPRGLLIVVGLSGSSDTGGMEGPSGDPVLLHFGPLPGGVSSATLFYALFRGDDVNGKGYVADLDDDQVRLNQAITMYAEMMSQFAYPQLFVAQGTQLLANQALGDRIIEYISNPGQPPPQYQFPGTGANFVAILNYIKDIREAAFRKGGWQASSRGESSGANEPASRARFLAAQDKMIFSNTAIAFRGSVIDMLQKNHALRRQYQTLPMLVDALGDELGYMAAEYVHKDEMSPSPPNFALVSGFGATAEERLQELNNLVVLRGGDGTPVLPVKRYWQLHPDQGLRPNEPDADDARRRRAHAINVAIEAAVEAHMMETGEDPAEPQPQIVQQLSAQIYQQFPPTWTDGFALPLFVEALDSLVQDPSVLPLVRAVAEERQKYLLQWQQQASGQQAQPNTNGSAEQAPGSPGAQAEPQAA